MRNSINVESLVNQFCRKWKKAPSAAKAGGDIFAEILARKKAAGGGDDDDGRNSPPPLLSTRSPLHSLPSPLTRLPLPS